MMLYLIFTGLLSKSQELEILPPPPPLAEITPKLKGKIVPKKEKALVPETEPLEREKPEIIPLEIEKSKHIEKIKRLQAEKVKENDSKLKKEIKLMAQNLATAVKGIDKYEYILTSEYEELAKLNEHSINNIKFELRSNADVKYDLDVLKAKIRGYKKLIETAKTNLHLDIDSLSNLYEEYKDKANGIRVAILSKLEQSDSFKKQGLPKASFKEEPKPPEEALARRKKAPEKEVEIPEELPEPLEGITAEEITVKEEEIPKLEELPELETKILEEESRGHKGFRIRLFKKLFPRKLEESRRELQEITTDVFDLTKEKEIKEFFDIQKVLFKEKSTERKRLAEEQKRGKEERRKEMLRLKREAEKKKRQERLEKIKAKKAIKKQPQIIEPEQDFAEIERAIESIKMPKLEMPSVMEEIPMHEELFKEEPIEAPEIKYEFDEIAIINQKIDEARDALLSMDTDKARHIYIEILKMYNALSVDKKKIVYESIKELYDERKNAEKVLVRVV